MPEFIDRNGKISSTSKDLFGVLAMHHETKTAKPGVSKIQSVTISNLYTNFKLSENRAGV